jgi:hypothetical protein
MNGRSVDEEVKIKLMGPRKFYSTVQMDFINNGYSQLRRAKNVFLNAI